MGAIHTRKITDPARAAPPTAVGRLLGQVARLQKFVQEKLVNTPGWRQFEKLAAVLTAPVRRLASATQRTFPFTRRFDWLLEIERLKSMHPVILIIAIAWAIRRGLFTTQYGHIGTDTLIYPSIATISYFNPFLGVVTAIAFGIGDIVQKFFVNDIFGTNGRDANYYSALVGYCLAYSSLMVGGFLPGVMSRLFSFCARYVISTLFSITARVRADGARGSGVDVSNLGNPLSGQYPIPELLASMAGAAIGGYGVMQLAPALEYPAFYLRPRPDVSCLNLEMATFLLGRSSLVAEAAAFGGPVLSTLLNPAEPESEAPADSGGGLAEPQAPPEPDLEIRDALLAASDQNIAAAEKRLSDLQAELNSLTPQRRDLVGNSPEYRNDLNQARGALDLARYARMQIQAKAGAPSDIGQPGTVAGSGTQAVPQDPTGGSGAQSGPRFDERSIGDIRTQPGGGTSAPGSHPVGDIRAQPGDVGGTPAPSGTGSPPAAGRSAFDPTAAQPGTTPSTAAPVPPDLIDRHHAEIFNPDGTLNADKARELAPHLSQEHVRELAQQVVGKAEQALSGAVRESKVLHDAERAAFQGNLSASSLALTMMNAARDVVAARKAEAAAAGSLTADEVREALRVAGLQAESQSPLSGLSAAGEVSNEQALSRLMEKGVVDSSGTPTKAWRGALETLAAPEQWVHLTVGDADDVQTVRFFVGRAGIVAHVTNADVHEIAFPAVVDESLEQAGEWLGWKHFLHAEPFSVDLSGEELAALGAATDAMREDQMRAALERRRPDQSHRFGSASLGAAIDMGLAAKGGRWLTEILNTHAPAPFAVSRDRLQAGLAAVSNRGWVTLKDDDVSLNSPLVGICLELGSSTPFLVIGIGSGSQPATYVMAVRGVTGFWTFRFGVPAADKIRFSRLGGKMLEGLVYHHLSSVLRAHRPSAEVPPQQSCASCDNPLRPDARFCTRCGTPTPPPASGG